MPPPSHSSSSSRTYILASFWTVVLFSIPFWWISTSIQRLPLDSLADSARESLETLRFSETVVLRIEYGAGFYARPLLESGRLADQVQVKLDSFSRGKGGDEIRVYGKGDWDELCNSRSSPSSPRPWEVVVHPSLDPYHPTEAPLPRERFNSIFGSLEDSTLHVWIAREDFDSLPTYLFQTLSHILPTSEHLLDAQDPKVAKFSDHYRLAFTLLLEDVTEGENPLKWEIERGLQATIQPLLDALSPLYTFTLESQIQYHSPLSVTSVLRTVESQELSEQEKDASEAEAPSSTWIVEKDDTKAFVNSEQWSLGSQGVVDDGPTLQFMLFVPRGERRPLGFEVEGQAIPSTSFLIPQQGSLVIYNPHSSPSSGSTLTSATLAPLLSTHLQHLRRLLGLPSSTIFLPPGTVLSRTNKPTRWELAWLARARTVQNVKDSVGGVMGLERLVGKIGEMRVGEKVRDDVRGAVQELEEVVRSTPSSPFDLFPCSSRALALSSRAFFNPTMLGLLYFPDEHKYAVYTPLFAPAGVPLVVALVKEIQRRRAASAKKSHSKKK